MTESPSELFYRLAPGSYFQPLADCDRYIVDGYALRILLYWAHQKRTDKHNRFYRNYRRVRFLWRLLKDTEK